LAITTLNKYSSGLTARQVGTSQRQWDDVRSHFENRQGLFAHTSGVTLNPGGAVFLSDNAFYQAGELAHFIVPDTDLSGVIVHELFHRAGLNEAQILALHPDIQRNCGSPGDKL